MKTQTKHSLMLMLCAFIWGTAFVAQSAAPHGGLFLPRRAQLAGCPCADPHRVRFRCRAQKTGPALRLAKREAGAKDPAGGGPRLRHLPVRGLCGSADRHHHQPVHGQGRVPDGLCTLCWCRCSASFWAGRVSAQLWVSMVIAVAGLYMLCMKNGFAALRPATGYFSAAPCCSASRSCPSTTFRRLWTVCG